jgi:ribose-phosphate pyrophosphokinase
LESHIVSYQDNYIARLLSEQREIPFVSVKVGTFADSESYVVLKHEERLREKFIILVHQFSLSEILNDQIMKLCFVADFIKQVGAHKIIAFLPYLPYTRQEKSFCEKYVGPIKLLSDYFMCTGIESVITCDVHSLQIQNISTFKLYNISMAPFWSEVILSFVQKNNIDTKNICIVSPDEGGIARVHALAQLLGVSAAHIDKERKFPDCAVPLKLSGTVDGLVAVIVDDIVDTARTAVQAAQLLLDSGALSVIGCFTHAVLSEGAYKRLENSAFDKVFVTDTLCANLPMFKHFDEKISLVSCGDFLTTQVGTLLALNFSV